jgi:hypothetical protein
MDGFKNTTKTQYMTGGSAKRAEAKMGKVMGEFASGKLHSGSKKGPEVKNPKQAVAIAMSEARKAGAKMPMKKSLGGGVFNERGQRATMAEVAAEDRRMGGKQYTSPAPKKPMASGSGIVPAVLAASKKVAAKAVPRGMGAMSDRDMQMLKAERKAMPTGAGAMSDREMQLLKETAKKGVPAYNNAPVVRRNKGGLMAMPKGKC